MSARRCAPWLAAALLLQSGCAAGIRTEELPESSIALLHRTADEAKRRSEILADAKKGEASARPSGYARVSDLKKLLGKDVRAEFADVSGHLSLLNPRTGEMTLLAAAPRGAEPLGYSADHHQLLFRVQHDTGLQLMLLDIPRDRLQPLTPPDLIATGGTIARDGRLVYSGLRVGPEGAAMRLFLETPGGGTPRPLTGGPADANPTFSPDGKVLIFVTHTRDGAEAIARLDPGEDDPVVRILARGRDPVFTPDGAWIVYSALVGAEHHLWKVRPDGSGKLPIGAASTDIKEEVHPAVSPDGGFVVYVTELDDRSYLRVRRIDGSGDRSLLDTGDAVWPAW